MIDAVKCDRLAGFLIGAQREGYSLDTSWDMLLNSKQGQGILNDDYEFAVHHMGIASAKKAIKDIGKNYKRGHELDPDISTMLLLATFIETANKKFKIPYENIFKKISISEFMEKCGYVLGNYDDKLIKEYIM